eukprot:TRINITY_DN799_c1_g1_i1.p1 TRINITY_DN799_c1_g1~~TRINITY_DN799_c1_g1_i1.p1  ORF type:complete len:277 (+),score=24.76 TRINITY_DN799_c1_g1_i1:42-833(+)
MDSTVPPASNPYVNPQHYDAAPSASAPSPDVAFADDNVSQPATPLVSDTQPAPHEQPGRLPGSPLNMSTSERITSAITRAGELAVAGIEKGAPVVQAKILQGTEAAKDRVTPNETPSDVNVNHVKKVRAVTTTAVKVSSHVSGKFVGVARMVGTRVGTVASLSDNKRVPGGVKMVVGTGFSVASTVVDSAAEALKDTATIARESTSGVVEYKYGDKAADAYVEGLGCVGDVVETGCNVHGVNPKKFVKVAGKQAVKEKMARSS